MFADESEEGPDDVPVMELAFNCNINVPSLQLVTETVYEEPDPVSVGELQDDEPPNLKSAADKSDTDWDRASV